MKKITYKQGNVVDALLNKEVDLLLHQVNCRGVYRSGLAKEIRERIPEAYESYMDHYNSVVYKSPNEVLLGDTCLGGGVINMFSQNYYGRDGKRYTNYGAMAKAMSSIINTTYCREHTIKLDSKARVGIPYLMGCGLGGGDWKTVEELIQYLLVPYFEEVIVYKL